MSIAKKILNLTFVFALTFALAGCAGMSTREQRVLSGGAIGAGAGAAIGGLTGGSMGTGAAIGGAAGAAGGLIHDEMND